MWSIMAGVASAEVARSAVGREREVMGMAAWGCASPA